MRQVMIKRVTEWGTLGGVGERTLRTSGQWRRNSEVVRRAVSTGLECALHEDDKGAIDAIITATSFGCMQDSVEFLQDTIQAQEELVSARAFMQSTFNVVGAQLGLLLSCHGYNMTYVGREHSFEDALLDGFHRVQMGDSNRVLVGAYDEIPPHKAIWKQVLCYDTTITFHEGHVFCTLCNDEEGILLEGIYFFADSMDDTSLRAACKVNEGCAILHSPDATDAFYPTLSARVLAKAVRRLQAGDVGDEMLLALTYPTGGSCGIHLRCV